jgi:hypothetical protein
MLLVLAATLMTQATPATELDRKDLIVIDGAAEPGQIPEWLAWEYSFTLLNLWQGKDSGFTHDLREALAPPEFELLEKEALAHKAREARRAALGTTLAKKYPYATTTDPKVIAQANDEAFAIDLEYRREILGSRDRMLQAFSAESQTVLLNWVAENKAAIKSYVQKSDLKRWRLPE